MYIHSTWFREYLFQKAGSQKASCLFFYRNQVLPIAAMRDTNQKADIFNTTERMAR
ncbi:MAG: hypothetical protein JRI87_05190 [Deltaproteobacteria bacterium]|nr:hypothetical protein [Deltaproteobacteria bacterium]